MSGRWVWCPDGCRVVPEVPTDEMLDAWDAAEAAHGDNELMVRAVVRAAPEPPSGWRQGKWLEAEQVLVWLPERERFVPRGVKDHLTTGMVVGWAPFDTTWWTPLPPPPEEGR